MVVDWWGNMELLKKINYRYSQYGAGNCDSVVSMSNRDEYTLNEFNKNKIQEFVGAKVIIGVKKQEKNEKSVVEC